jgi:hypothetical protein
MRFNRIQRSGGILLQLCAISCLSCSKLEKWPVVGWPFVGEFGAEQVYDVQMCPDGEFWYASVHGLFQVRGQKVVQKLSDPTLIVKSLDDQCRELWAVTGSKKEVVGFSTISDEITRLETPNGDILTGVNALAAAEGGKVLWVGTDTSLIKYSCSGKARPSRACSGRMQEDWARAASVKYLAADGKNIWTANPDEVVLFYEDEGASVGRLDWCDDEWRAENARVSGVTSAGGLLWVTTIFNDRYHSYGWSLRRDSGTITTVSRTDKLGILAVAECNGKIYFGTTAGRFLSAGMRNIQDGAFAEEELKLDQISTAPVRRVACLGSKVWHSAGYAVQRDKELLRMAGPGRDTGAISGITGRDGRWLAWGTAGLVRFCEADVQLNTSIVTIAPSVGLSLGRIIRVKDVDYVDRFKGECIPPGSPAGSNLDVFMGLGLKELEANVETNSKVTLGDEFGRDVGAGVFSVYFQVQDREGAIVKKKTYDSVYSLHEALSPLLTFGFWAVLLSWAISSLGLVFSPWNLLAMSVIDSRFFRTRISFGLIPSVLLFGLLRRHVLSRYRRQLALSFDRRLGRYRRQLALSFDRRLGGSGKLLSDTQMFETIQHLSSGLVITINYKKRCSTELFHWLSLCFCERMLHNRSGIAWPSFVRLSLNNRNISKKRFVELRRAVPVYLPLAAYLTQKHSDSTIEDIVSGVLGEFANFGDINDPELGRYFLDQGGFIFFLEDYHQICDHGRHVVQRFINRYERENFFVIGVGEGSQFPELRSPIKRLRFMSLTCGHPSSPVVRNAAEEDQSVGDGGSETPA